MNDPRQPLGQGNHPVQPQQPHPVQPHAPQPVRPGVPAQPGARPGIAPVPMLAKPKLDEDAIALVDDDEFESVPAIPAGPASPTSPVARTAAPTSTMNKIKFGPDVTHKKHDWKRKTIANNSGACRVRSFHGKYSDQGIEYMDDQINEWLDAHPEVEIKFVTSTVGVFEGKIREPALVLNLWY